MYAELGQFFLIVAVVLAGMQSIAAVWAVQRGNVLLAVWLRRIVYLHAFALLLSLLALAGSFWVFDYSVAYVASQANNVLPLVYRISAVWGGHEGSLLLWVFLLAAWGAVLVWRSRSIPPLLLARVVAVMGGVSLGFLLFVQLTSNPFARLLPLFPLDGADLNPLLQDPGLIVHPPLLYMGYVGFSVAFSFAVAGLWQGQIDSVWARWAKPWTLAAWSFLTIGITLGSWWAYYELGWGGWWFWDPVENASLMPWIAGTALLHSMTVAEKRDAFKIWTIFLAIAAFSLSLLGTFLVRSGVLTSVHAFANDPERGAFILGFLVVVCGGALLLFALRSAQLTSQATFRVWSRETVLLGNNVLMMFALAIVLIGTLAPLVGEAFEQKISVGAPYFNVFSSALGPVLLLVLGPGIYLRWKRHDPASLVRPAVMASLLVALVAVMVWTAYGFTYQVLSHAMTAWVFAWAVWDVIWRTRNAETLSTGLRRLGRSYWAMQLAHVGLLVMIVGIVQVSMTDMEKDVRLAPGESYAWANYEIRLDSLREVDGPNYQATQAIIGLYRDGKALSILYPEKRNYQSGMPMTEASIDAGFWRDVYVALGEPLPEGAWAVRIYDKPFVRWLWLGGLLMALGGFVAMTDQRYRMARLVRQMRAADSGKEQVQ